MVVLFKDRSPVAVVWLFLLSFAVHSNFIFSPPQVIIKQDGLLSVFLDHFIRSLSPLLLLCIYQLMVVVQALLLNSIFNDHRMFSRTNYLVAMVYILMVGVFSEWHQISSALIINSNLIWLFALYIKMYNHPHPKSLIFNIGFITGVTILLFHPLSLLVLVALFAVLVVRPFNVTELLVLFLGVFVPVYFLFSGLYLTDKTTLYNTYIPHITFSIPDVQLSKMFVISAGILSLIMLIGLYYWKEENKRLLIQVRKNWGLLLGMLALLLPTPFINEDTGIGLFILLLIPASPFIAKGFFVPKKNTLPNIMFWTLMVLVIVKTWRLVQ